MRCSSRVFASASLAAAWLSNIELTAFHMIERMRANTYWMPPSASSDDARMRPPPSTWCVTSSRTDTITVTSTSVAQPTAAP